MQRLASADLSALRTGIATACYERTRVLKEQHEFRHCPRYERHARWEQELDEIEERRTELLRKQAAILKESRKYGVGVSGLCI